MSFLSLLVVVDVNAIAVVANDGFGSVTVLEMFPLFLDHKQN